MERYSIVLRLSVNVVNSEAKCSTCHSLAGTGKRQISFSLVVSPKPDEKLILYTTVQCEAHSIDNLHLMPINSFEDLVQAQNIVEEALSTATRIKDFIENIESRREDFLKLVRKSLRWCFSCRKPNAKMICGGCHLLSYCSPECQRTDWPTSHTNACNMIKTTSIVAEIKICRE